MNAPDARMVWDAVAPAWGASVEGMEARGAGISAAMLDRADLRPTDRVLELACGPGSVGLAAAASSGHVVLSDVSPAMVEIALGRAAQRGLTNVTGEVIDLAAIDSPPSSYDVVLCRDGLQFSPSPTASLAAIHSALRPGGRLSIATWAARQLNPWLGIVSEAAGLPNGLPGPFRLGDPVELKALLDEAGFIDVSVGDLAVPMRMPGFDQWWQRTTSLAGGVAAKLRPLPPAEQDAVRSRARALVQPYETSDGIEFPGLALLASGRRPVV